MKLRLVALAAAILTLTSSAYFAAKQVLHWKRRGWKAPPHEFDGFVAELDVAIPPNARVLVVNPKGAIGTKYALLLNARLHPRVFVTEGPADWIVEMPDEEFVRARASYRRAGP